nr:immunoglobulin heavy chain junction region [Macaca mulatta]MPN84029.1 immunoglobulin heavy chain junction region [Macaca mulatta]MPN84155.1 immunoglobulin heavy chain junction region [Macaca mulatta]MPN84176.1 immunoglobulin heavy chain junction region [Macaca mulatta]MPN84247.1 immunoglobulin heavy chain junction region [Macaca mulatta]
CARGDHTTYYTGSDYW